MRSAYLSGNSTPPSHGEQAECLARPSFADRWTREQQVMHVHVQDSGDLVQGLERRVGLLKLDLADLRALCFRLQSQLLLRNGQLSTAHLDIDREIGLHLVELNHLSMIRRGSPLQQPI